MENYIIIHYAEIGLKGKNRPFFEKKLINNIRKKLIDYKVESVRNIYGRILVRVNTDDLEGVAEILKKIPGIKYFAFSKISSQDIKDILDKSYQLLENVDFKKFRITTKRASKEFSLNSQQINEKVGEYILKKIPNIKVDLSDPDETIYIEIVNQYVFLYSRKLPGIGGLPVGTSGRVLSLISSGIDSPVASYRMMKRGAKVLFVHFHSYPQTSSESKQDVVDLIKELVNFQGKSKLYLIPFLEFQKEVVEKGNVRDRVILYRRMMIRVAEAVAEEEKINTLVTGESLGQVASQTLQNMHVISNACKNTQVFKPLICYDKEEIISEAKNISTYDISSRGHEDCCSLFVPTSPNTQANLLEIKEQEKNIEIEKHLRDIKNSWDIKIIN